MKSISQIIKEYPHKYAIVYCVKGHGIGRMSTITYDNEKDAHQQLHNFLLKQNNEDGFKLDWAHIIDLTNPSDYEKAYREQEVSP